MASTVISSQIKDVEEHLLPTEHSDINKGSESSASSSEDKYQSCIKIVIALFYASCSLLITIINKSVLTSYTFPSFQVLAFGHMFATIVVLFIGKKLKIVSFPDFSTSTFSDISPLPFIYLGNMIFSLGGTKLLSLPMFTMLRRFTILMTMIGEYYLLSVSPKLPVTISACLLVLGAIVAATGDLAFNLQGYVFVLLSDLSTASYGVYTKKKLNNQKEIGKYGLMFYCSLFMLPFSLYLIYETGDIELVSEFPDWLNLSFLSMFLLSCGTGFVFNYSVMLCTQYNSALTTAIIGCLKNILVAYLGMFIGGDYIFSMSNFIGINLSVLGSLVYTFVAFIPSTANSKINKPVKVVVDK